MLKSNMGLVAILEEQERHERLRLLDDQQNAANAAAMVENLDIYSEKPSEESIHTESEPEDDSDGTDEGPTRVEEDRLAAWEWRRFAAATRRQAQ